LSEALKKILNQQKSWALRFQIDFNDKGYTLEVNDNLFQPLSEHTVSDFKSGRGNELKTEKIKALHSSSALVSNVFEYWRPNSDGIALACGADKGMSLRFEKQNPTGLHGTAPHLDVEFTGAGKKPLAVESKFTEFYQHEGTSNFKSSYFKKPGLWDRIPRCEQLAKSIYGGQTVFKRLDAAQLLKHILGLKKAFPSGFRLLYLWYEMPSEAANTHQKEIRMFEDHVQSEVDFRHMTYQDLFKTVKEIPDIDPGYISYLEERYFGDPS
jgi:hypothetical protein